MYICIYMYMYMYIHNVCTSVSLLFQDEFSRLVEKWNAQRAQAVYSALIRFLYPLMQKELHTKLLMEAKEHILRVREGKSLSFTCITYTRQIHL